MKKKVGRPKLPKDKTKSTVLLIRLPQEEKAAMQQDANKEGVTLSKWARKTLLDSLKCGICIT